MKCTASLGVLLHITRLELRWFYKNRPHALWSLSVFRKMRICPLHCTGLVLILKVHTEFGIQRDSYQWGLSCRGREQGSIPVAAARLLPNFLPLSFPAPCIQLHPRACSSLLGNQCCNPREVNQYGQFIWLYASAEMHFINNKKKREKGKSHPLHKPNYYELGLWKIPTNTASWNQFKAIMQMLWRWVHLWGFARPKCRRECITMTWPIGRSSKNTLW